MVQVVEVTGLQSQADAEERAENFSIDGVPVDILPQADGTFTVRATYPDDVNVPGAVQVPAGGGGAAAPAGGTPGAPAAPAAAPSPVAAAPAAAPAAPAAPGGTDGAAFGTQISQRAIDLIVQNEVSSQAAYQRLYHIPTWPQGQSGVTVGIGYDCGYTTPAQLALDWSGQLPPASIAKLQTACGIHGAAAGPLASSLSDVDVPWAAAMAVFLKRDVPRWTGIVENALANCNQLSPDSLGALVSLAYNRGASFSEPGDRYVEMNNIRMDMANGNFADIPAQIRSMKRLWPTMPGLRTRRDQEAQLFQDGLA